MEKEPKIDSEKEIEKDSVDFIRHSVSSYKTYGKIVSSDNPTGQFNPDEQVTPDLPEKGIELAKQEAEKYFAELDPQKDIVFFVSSNEARAVETANIFRQTAHEKGFEVVKPEHSRSMLSDNIAEGEIRVLQNLSIYPDDTSNSVLDGIFNPPARRGKVNWEAVKDTELKARYDKASAIIEADDRGSFGANFAVHSEAIKQILPEITTAEELYKTQFQNLIKLLKFGIEKAKKAGLEKNVKIIAFGHENYLMLALEKMFQEDGIKNCEVIHFSEVEDKIKAEFRGKEADVE
jgi:hypothetical protein